VKSGQEKKKKQMLKKNVSKKQLMMLYGKMTINHFKRNRLEKKTQKKRD